MLNTEYGKGFCFLFIRIMLICSKHINIDFRFENAVSNHP